MNPSEVSQSQSSEHRSTTRARVNYQHQQSTWTKLAKIHRQTITHRPAIQARFYRTKWLRTSKHCFVPWISSLRYRYPRTREQIARTLNASYGNARNALLARIFHLHHARGRLQQGCEGMRALVELLQSTRLRLGTVSGAAVQSLQQSGSHLSSQCTVVFTETNRKGNCGNILATEISVISTPPQYGPWAYQGLHPPRASPAKPQDGHTALQPSNLGCLDDQSHASGVRSWRSPTGNPKD